LEYILADTVAEALTQIGNGGLVLAGGTTLVPRLDREAPSKIVDISRIGDLRGIQDSGKCVRIGAAVTLERAAEVLCPHPSLRAVHAALLTIGNPHIRLVATLGGNVCASDQVRDLTTALTALDARVTVAHLRGVEETAIDAFLASTLPGAWLLTTIAIPIDPMRRSSFRKLAWRLASAPAVFNVAAAARVVNNRLSDARIVIGGTAKVPIRVRSAEALLDGRVLDAANIATAASSLARAMSAGSPPLATTGYVQSALPRVMHDAMSEMLVAPQ
jgi:carbon-monoxide dehydrogenase medium subunit